METVDEVYINCSNLICVQGAWLQAAIAGSVGRSLSVLSG